MNKYLQEAVLEASKSRCRQRHGAVIVHKGSIISRGHNALHCRPEPNSGVWRTSTHAEAVALGRLGTVPNGARIYVARLTSDNKPAMSAPCRRCYSQISRSGIRSISWT